MKAILRAAGGALLPGASGAGVAFLSEEGSNHLAQPSEVLGGVAILRAAEILGKDYIQNPMLVILDAPVVANQLRYFHCGHHAAADVMADLHTLLVPLPPFPDHLDDGVEVLPLLLGAQPLRVVNQRHHPLFLSAVADLTGDENVVRDSLKTACFRLGKAGPDVGMQSRLVVLDRQQVVRPACADLL